MVSEDLLKDLLSQSKISNTDKMLITMSLDAEKTKAVKEIKKIALRAGLRSIDKLNVSNLLSGSKGFAVRTEKGWELTTRGKQHVSELCGSPLDSPVSKVSASLRLHLSSLSNPDTSKFLEEAIKCYEQKLYRAAVVLTWVGAIAVLYDFIVCNKLVEFNAEALRRNPKWKNAKNINDLARMKEHDFLDLIESISIIGKSVKQELDGCLRFRNGCGHPNSLKISEHRVAGHIESLILNVFAPFA